MIKFWIVVADEGAARIFEQRHPDKDPQEIEVLQHLQAHARELVPPPRRGLSARRTGADSLPVSAGEPPQQLEGERFAARLSERLSGACQRGQFDKLYIAAAPRFLGMLRKTLKPEVTSRLVGQVDKDLHQMAPRELGIYVSERLAQPH